MTWTETINPTDWESATDFFAAVPFTPLPAFAVGTTVNVTWGNEKYALVIKRDEANGMVYIGNYSIPVSSETDTGEPFCIVLYSDGFIEILSRSNNLVVVSVTGLGIVKHTLPEDYFPSQVTRIRVSKDYDSLDAGSIVRDVIILNSGFSESPDRIIYEDGTLRTFGNIPNFAGFWNIATSSSLPSKGSSWNADDNGWGPLPGIV